MVSKRTMVPGTALLLVASMTTAAATGPYETSVLSLGELQWSLRVAHERRALTASEIDLGLIPEILERREELGDALLGHPPPGFSGPGPCWNELAGRITCERLGMFGCLELACRVDPERTCTNAVPCDPDDHDLGGVLIDPIDDPPGSYP